MLELVFCNNTDLWKSDAVNQLALKEDFPEISPQVISVPVIGEQRIDGYNNLTMKGSVDMTVAELEKKLASLLVIIQPTQEKQIQDDYDVLERAMSTTVSFVRDKYKAVELNVV